MNFSNLASKASENSLSGLNAKRKVVIIGAGSKRGIEFIKAIMKFRTDCEIVALVVNEKIPEELKQLNCPIYSKFDIQKLLSSGIAFDTAIVSVPHYLHHSITLELNKRHIFVIKEKPLALSTEFALQYQSAPHVYTTLQREVSSIYTEARNHLNLIGDIVCFSYLYSFSLPHMTTGWRAEKKYSGGGVVIDMGYHPIDVVNQFFGKPSTINAKLDYKHKPMEMEKLEDHAVIKLIYKRNPNSKITGEIILDRHAKKNEEIFVIRGEKGIMTITPTRCQIVDLNEKLVYEFEHSHSKEDLAARILDKALSSNNDLLLEGYLRNLITVEIIDKIYSEAH